MDKNSTTEAAALFSGEAWFDPIEAELRNRIRRFLEEMSTRRQQRWDAATTSAARPQATGMARA